MPNGVVVGPVSIGFPDYPVFSNPEMSLNEE